MGKPIFRVVVAGGREFDNFELLTQKLDRLLSKKLLSHQVIIVSGTARGADKLGERYAQLRNLEIDEFPADWDGLGRKAGYVRNTAMAEVANGVIVFWDGASRGSKQMIDLALKKKLTVRVVRY